MEVFGGDDAAIARKSCSATTFSLRFLTDGTVGGRFIIDMYELRKEWTGLWNVPRNGLVRGTACRQALHQKRALRDSPHLKLDTVVRRLHRKFTRHDPKTDGIELSRSRDLCASTQSKRTDRETCANVWDDDGRVSARNGNLKSSI